MKKRLKLQNRFVAPGIAFGVLCLLLGVVVVTEKPTSHTTLGNDISYPQCNAAFPTGQTFGIVGVNGGIASNSNPCLKKQLTWAARSSGISLGQPRIQLYLNTGNPGDQSVAAWPHNNQDPASKKAPNPYGLCNGDNSLSCGWQYGWNQATVSAHSFLPAAAKSAHLSSAPSSYTWWLDVETKNSWQTDSVDGLARNRASLEGMVAALRERDHLKVGLYSTSYQWHKIVGDIPAQSNLTHLDTWFAGAEGIKDAEQKCTTPPLTPGSKVVLVQFVSGKFDYNFSCFQTSHK